MGGIVIAITLIIGTMILYSSHKELLPLTLTLVGFGFVGFVDDFKKLVFRDTEGLKPAYKIIGLLIISVMYSLYLIKLGIGTRNNNSRIKIRDNYASNIIYTIFNFCNACCDECSKFNRWN